MSRFLATVRHLSLRQIVTRATFMAERTLRRAILPRPRPWRAPVPPNGEFLTAPAGSRLREFQMQAFEYARVLDRDAFQNAAKSWIDAHRHRTGDAWHPYPISLRIASWCDALLRQGDDPEIRASLHAQARFLAKHLEHDVRGNHLLENARALVRAGAFLGDDALLARGVRILHDEVPEQILPDGGHFERTPGYHVRVLEILEDAANDVNEPRLHDAIVRMHAFLDAITPPDGRLPLLKDTTHTSPLSPPQPHRGGERVRVRGAPAANTTCFLPHSGFAVIRNDETKDFLIADFGRVGPDYLPAHAHADMFSFELTIGGSPVIVDSGVFEYAAGEWRTWFRSTAAHNTVEVDGRDQSEIWSSFRVGRRAEPRNIRWIDDASFAAIAGEHDGYGPVLHHRTIIALHEARIWIVADRLSGPANHVARSFIHLHPDTAPPHIVPLGGAITTSDGWYSERFGEKRPNRVLVLEATTPAWFGYVIGVDDAVTATLRADGDRCVIDVTSRVWHGAVHLGPPDALSLQRIR